MPGIIPANVILVFEIELLEASDNTITKLEQKHAAGYTQNPVEPGEFDLWETEQVWNEE